MDSEQFFLKWNNFESNLASGFADLLQKEAMVDVTIAAEGKIIQAHKIILSICSSYFRNMFQVNPCQHPIVVLKDVRYQELTDMLDFMYKGEANVRQEDLPSFLKLAETLKVKGLAVTQGELDESSIKKNSESQISTVTKNSPSFTREEPTNDSEDREALARKKTKRCSSPLAYPEARALPHSPNIKMEMEECDNNFMRTSVNTNGRNTVVKEERLSDSSMDSYGESQVANESWRVDKMAGRSTVDENMETVPQGTLQVKDYSFLESRYGKRQIIVDGYSFRKKNAIPGKSYWLCCAEKCSAKGILQEDGTFRLTAPAHNHKPNQRKLKRQEELARLKKLALQEHVSGQQLLLNLGMMDDFKKNLEFIRTCRKRDKNRARLAPLHVGLNYELKPTRYSEKGLLCHSGHTYRKDSVNPRDKNCKYWKCTLYGCKGRAKTDGDGNLTILNPFHSHFLKKTKKSLNGEGQDPSNDPEKQDEMPHRRKSDRLSQREGKDKLVSHVGVQNSTFCPDSDTFNLDKLVAAALNENDCVASTDKTVSS